MRLFFIIFLSVMVAIGIVVRLMELEGTPTIWNFARDMFLTGATLSSLYVAVVLGYAIGCAIKHFNP